MAIDPGVDAAPVRALPTGRPFAWLVAGWRDLMRTPGLSLAHGLAMLLGGVVILFIGRGHFGLLAGAFSGFVLLAPLLVFGLYELSRRHELGQPANLNAMVRAWRHGGGAPIRMGIALALTGTAWVGVSTLLVMDAPTAAEGGALALVRTYVGAEGGLRVFVWLLAGGMLASIVFAVCAVSWPMLLDRDVGLRRAVLTSVAAVGGNPASMVIWAGLIMLLTLFGLVTVLGLVVVVPWLGHATWHAYVDTVDRSAMPPRT